MKNSSNKVSQRTLKRSVFLAGCGLHSGRDVRLAIRPSQEDSGVRFIRTDIPGAVAIPALTTHVVDTQMATTLGYGKVRVSTVEHLMSALYGLGVDNAIIEIDGPEVPILDGSAQHFIEAISSVGLVSQKEARRYLVIRKAIEVRDGDKWARLEPAENLSVVCTIDFEHPSIATQNMEVEIDEQNFTSFIGPARTFGFLEDVERLKALGLAKGGSLSNAVVVGQSGVLNPEGLRFADEFVRHKVLDALGDLALIGYRLIGRVTAHKSGHALHHALAEALLKGDANYDLVEKEFGQGARNDDASWMQSNTAMA